MSDQSPDQTPKQIPDPTSAPDLNDVLTGPLAQLLDMEHNAMRRNRDYNDLVGLIVECLPDALVIINEDGDIVLFNTQAELLFGYHRSEVVGKKLEVLMPERYHLRHVRRRDQFVLYPVVRPMLIRDVKLYGQRKTGTEFEVNIMLAPMVTPQGVFTLAAIRRALLPELPPMKFNGQ